MAYNQNQYNFPSFQTQDSDTNTVTSNSTSLDTANDQGSTLSDCENSVSGPSFDKSSLFNSGLIQLFPKDKAHDVIKKMFLSNLAMEKKCGGDANVKYAWCPTTRDVICKIVEHGFGHYGLLENSGLYGCGVYLSPDVSSMER
ncbi:hypothetical protein CRYUN_Cryun19dG0047400 [Craigia yunnanensis]